MMRDDTKTKSKRLGDPFSASYLALCPLPCLLLHALYVLHRLRFFGPGSPPLPSPRGCQLGRHVFRWLLSNPPVFRTD